MRFLVVLALVAGGCSPDGGLQSTSFNFLGPQGSPPAASPNASRMAWGDYDGDGDLDLFVATSGSTADQLFENDGGTLTLTAGVFSSDQVDSRDAAWADLDADGALELVVARYGSPSQAYAFDEGFGTFSGVWGSSGSSNALALALADYDSDGDIDLMLGVEAGVNEYYEGTAAGLESTATLAPSSSDTLDLVAGRVSNELTLGLVESTPAGATVLLHNGTNFDASIVPDWPPSVGSRLALADVTGDFADDLASAFDDASTRVWQSGPTGFNGFPALAPDLPPFPVDGRAVALGDADGDGLLELAVAHHGEEDRVWDTTDGASPGIDEPPSGSGSGTTDDSIDARWVDVDGDGGLELFTIDAGAGLVSWDDRLLRFSNLSTALFNPSSDYSGIFPADWNCDGFVDFAILNGFDVDVLRNTQLGFVERTAEPGSGFATRTDAAWADFDGDGAPDLVAGSTGGSKLWLSPGCGTLDFGAAPFIGSFGVHSTALAAADFDGDEDVDLAVGLQTGGVALYRNDGDPEDVLDVVDSTLTGPGAPTDLAWSDPDADGDPDLAVAYGSELRLHLNDGGDLTSDVVILAANAGGLAWADLDDDGTPELVVTGTGGSLQVYRFTAPNSLVAEGAPLPAGFADALAVGDADQNGTADLFVAGDAEPRRVYSLIGTELVLRGEEPLVHPTSAMGVGDLDGDGDTDLLLLLEEVASVFRLYTAHSDRLTSGHSQLDPLSVAELRIRDTSLVPPTEVGSAGEAWTAAFTVDEPELCFQVRGPPGEFAYLEFLLSLDHGPWQPLIVDQSDAPYESQVTHCVAPIAPIAPDPSLVSRSARIRASVTRQASRRMGGSYQRGRLVSTSSSFALALDNCDVSLDSDGDGDPDCSDCADADPQIHAAATEVCDGQDNDCDGVSLIVDADGDGYASELDCIGGDDCDDTDDLQSPAVDQDGDGWNACEDCVDLDGSINPGAPEIDYDGIDQNCSGTDTRPCGVDNDGDTQAGSIEPHDGSVCAPSPLAFPVVLDCDDGDGDRFLGNAEVCDGVDNDCVGPNPPPDEVDADGDGFSPCEGDCDDTDALVAPLLLEECDGVDTDCDGTLLVGEEDADNDGYLACADDCDDSNLLANPGLLDFCDGVDNDCNGTVDDGAVDYDGDGYSGCAEDCVDNDAAIHPGAEELCDGIDNDCDGVSWSEDADGDGFESAAMCLDGEDCDDGDAAVHPDAVEDPEDGVDNNCDGFDGWECREDLDGDGVGGVRVALSNDGCDRPGIAPPPEDNASCGEVDCDDTDPFTHPCIPDEELLCNRVDRNCDGVVGPFEDGDTYDVFADADADGYGGTIHPLSPMCATPEGYLETSGDCDDSRFAVNPDADEICDGIDNDCDGVADNDFPVCDGDTVASCMTLDEDCDGVDRGLGPDADCDDQNPTVHPGAEELCDGIDNDCDAPLEGGEIDPIEDADGDGAVICGDCDANVDGLPFPCDDCDDGDATAHPGALEICSDAVDQDCDGAEAFDAGDPDCWEPACGGCNEVSGESAGVLGLLVLLFGWRRRDRLGRHPAAAVLVVALLLPAASFAQNPVQAAASADLTTARGALLELRTSDESSGLRNVLEARFAELDLLYSAPVSSSATVQVSWDGGSFVDALKPGDFSPVSAVPAGLELRLVVRVLGRQTAHLTVPPLRPRELRSLVVPLRDAGTASVRQIATADGVEMAVDVAGTRTPLQPGQVVEVSAGPVTMSVSNGQQEVRGEVELSRGQELLADPERWRPASLTLRQVPAGSRIGVFVEGAEGLFVDVASAPNSEGAVDADSGLPLIDSLRIDGLVAGAAGIYLEHPTLGRRADELTIGAQAPAELLLDWRTLPGTPDVVARWTDRQKQLTLIERRTGVGTALGIGAAVGGIVSGSVFALLASDASIAADQAQSSAIEAVLRHDYDTVQARRADYDTAIADQRAYTVGTILGSVVGGLGLGVSIAVPLEGRMAKRELGDWVAW